MSLMMQGLASFPSTGLTDFTAKCLAHEKIVTQGRDTCEWSKYQSFVQSTCFALRIIRKQRIASLLCMSIENQSRESKHSIQACNQGATIIESAPGSGYKLLLAPPSHRPWLALFKSEIRVTSFPVNSFQADRRSVSSSFLLSLRAELTQLPPGGDGKGWQFHHPGSKVFIIN